MKGQGSVPPRLRVREADSFPVAFAQALDRRGVSLESLRRRLRERGHAVALSTLSYWRSGQRRPEHAASLEALAEIEALLGLEPDDLARRLGPARRSRPADTTLPLGEAAAFERAQAMEDAFADLRAESPAGFAEQSSHVVARVGAGGGAERIEVRTVYRALGEGADLLPVVWGTAEADWPLPGVQVVAGGHLDPDLDRSQHHLGVLARGLRLDRPLRAGEETVVETHFLLDGVTDRSHEHVLLRSLHEVVVWVTFRDFVPEGVETYWANGDDDEGSLPLEVAGARGVHHRRTGFGPGHIGLRWW